MEGNGVRGCVRRSKSANYALFYFRQMKRPKVYQSELPMVVVERLR